MNRRVIHMHQSQLSHGPSMKSLLLHWCALRLRATNAKCIHTAPKCVCRLLSRQVITQKRVAGRYVAQSTNTRLPTSSALHQRLLPLTTGSTIVDVLDDEEATKPASLSRYLETLDASGCVICPGRLLSAASRPETARCRAGLCAEWLMSCSFLQGLDSNFES